MVVRLSGDDSFAIDIRNGFGLASSGGGFEYIAKPGTQIMRANGIGPIARWVDDHILFRIRKEYMDAYNKRRKEWAADIASNGGELHDGGRLWFKGKPMPNDRPEEFDEDMAFPIKDLSDASPR